MTRCLASGRRHRERGTASMEAILCLPFVFLIFALVLNMGYGWNLRMRTDTAARFAANYNVHLLSEQVDESEARRRTDLLVKQMYFPASDPIRLTIVGSEADLSDLRGPGGSSSGNSYWRDLLGRVGRAVNGRRSVLLSVPREVPTGTLLPATRVEAAFALDGNTWTHQEVPLTLDALTDVMINNNLPAGLDVVLRFAGYGVSAFFWLLGMEP